MRSLSLRLLIVDTNSFTARLLKDQLGLVGEHNIHIETSFAYGAAALACHRFDAVLVSSEVTKPDLALAFVKAVRTHDLIRDRFVPVIVLADTPTRSLVEKSRDAGANCFLARPTSAKQVYMKVLKSIRKDRQFVRCENFFGPDRRRHNGPSHDQAGISKERRSKRPQRETKFERDNNFSHPDAPTWRTAQTKHRAPHFTQV